MVYHLLHLYVPVGHLNRQRPPYYTRCSISTFLFSFAGGIMSQLVLFRHSLERSLHSQLQVFSEYSSAQNVIMTHMIILKKSTTMFLEKVIFLIAYHLFLTFMFSSMKSFLYTKNVGKHPNIASQ